MNSTMATRKFLVLRLSSVGDVLRTLPAVKALKETFPESRVTWVAEEASVQFLEAQPGIDEVILFPRKRWMRSIRRLSGIRRTLGEIVHFIGNLRRQAFDVVLDFHGILKSGLLSYLSGAPQRIGFDRTSSREGNFLFSNVKVSLPVQRVSRLEKNFSLLRGLGLEVKRFHPQICIPAEDREFIETFFSRLPYPRKKPLIALHCGTSPKTVYKRWIPERYSRLADRLVRDLGASVIFTWGPSELKWIESIRNGMEEESILAPRTETLTQLGELLRWCDLYIGGDTGPMHLASMIGTPVVVIYGPTDAVINEPLGRHVKIQKEVGCNPCRKRSCRDLRCVESITVEDVMQGVREILAQKG